MNSKKIPRLSTLTFRFGRAIKRFRERSEISQVTLASRIEVHASYLSLVERGRRNPSVDLLRRVCKELDLAPEVFLLYTAVPTDSMRKDDRKVIEDAQNVIEAYLEHD